MSIFESTDFTCEPSVMPSPAPLVHEVPDETPELLECCKRTIQMHAKNNPMMVCGECKKIIKVFDNEKAYRNYQRFCMSRHRRFLATHFMGRHVITFKNYDSYSA
jgi:hypothetical protein